MTVKPPMRRLRFTLDVCLTSRGDLVAGELKMKHDGVKKPMLLGSWSGGKGELEMLLRSIKIKVEAAQSVPFRPLAERPGRKDL